MKELLSRKEAAEIFGVNIQTISNWCKEGLLKKMENKKNTLIIRASVEKLIAEFKELPSIEREISEKMESVKTLRNELEQLKEEINNYEKLFWGKKYVRKIWETVVDIYANFTKENEYITNMEKDILLTLIEDDSKIEELKEKWDMRKEQIRVIVQKSMRILKNEPHYIKEEIQALRDENYRLKRENQELKYASIDKKWEYVRYLYDKKRDEKNNSDTYEYPTHLYERGRILGLTKEEVNSFMEYHSFPVTDFKLSIRALNCLKAASMETIGDIVTREKKELLQMRYFGRKSLIEIEDLVNSLGLVFGINENFLLNG